MKSKRTFSLSTWLALLVTGAVVPLLVLAGLTLFEISKNSRALIDQGQTDTARALAIAVDGEVRSWRSALEALAASKSLQPGRTAEFYEEARQVASRYEGWIVLNDAEGQQHLNTLLPFGAPLPRTGAREMVDAVFREGKPLTDMVFGAAAKRYIISNSIPLYRDGRVEFCFSLNFGPERLTRLLQSQNLPASWVAVINDSQRRVVARSRDAEARIGKPVVEWFAAATRAAEHGLVTGPLMDGRTAQIAFEKLQEAPWVVALAVPTSELHSAASIWRFILAGVILGLAAVGVAVSTGRRITLPVIRLAAAGGPLVRGEDVDLGPPSGIQQVRDLQQALVEASAAIQERYRERGLAEDALQRAKEVLEVRVTERTAALTRANEALQTGNAAHQEDIRQRERAEQALRDSREDLSHAQAAAQTGSWRLDTLRNELLWSDETYRMFGIPSGTPLTYEMFLGIVHPEDRRYVDQQWTAALRGAPYDIEHRIVVGEAVKWVRERAELEFDRDGGLLGGIGTVQEITSRKRMEEEIRALARFPEENPNPVLRIGREGRILYANHASGPLLRLWDRQAGQDLSGAWLEQVQDVYEAGQLRELEIECADHTFTCTLTPIRDAGYVNIYARDITARKRAEEEVRRLNAELQQRLVELEEANAELESFSYSVSHDLRAPLRAMNGFSRLLVEEHGPQLPPEAQHYLGVVRENALQMGRLVDDLLTFSRLSRQPLQRQPVDLTALVREVFESLQAERAARQVELVVADLAPCEGDPAMLRQVVANLLANALKFTRSRETARIEVGCQTQAGDAVYFVRDNGVGFDMRYVDKLFGVFQRLHRAEEYEGTGVGLAIVQRIIQRHGGRICAEGEVGKGAVFYFTLSGWPPTFRGLK